MLEILGGGMPIGKRVPALRRTREQLDELLAGSTERGTAQQQAEIGYS